MKYRLPTLSVVLSTLTCSVFYSAIVTAEVAVIVHPSNNNALSKMEVKKIFLGKKKNYSDGGVVLPIDLQEGSAAREEFSKALLGKTPNQLKAYWSKLVFTGKGAPPKSVRTPSEVISTVSTNPSSIGYIEASEVTDQVKVVGTY